MTTTADKIRALPIYDYLSAEAAYGFACAREAAAALVEAEPQAVRVKPLVWTPFHAGGCTGRPKEFQYFVTQKHNGQYFCHFDESSHDHLDDAKANCDRHYQIADLDLTPNPVDASPASDPVSKTPTLDAMAMQRAAIDQMGQMFRAGVSPEKWPDYIAAITLPAADALAEALALPEVKTLIDWIEAATRDTFDLPLSFDAWPEMTVGDIQDQLAKLRENADAALKGAAE